MIIILIKNEKTNQSFNMHLNSSWNAEMLLHEMNSHELNGKWVYTTEEKIEGETYFGVGTITKPKD